ncbi:topoisomerase 1-associated factor 1 [Lepidopterella palustris CBS 459.81]|uniref:Topoisomerase 1-associated factor 1 n=1 Tax=Lepidopterella palustris CBS 459.81 TaxID=1314670 RepID=A0A8E2ELN6_9PEZI|nr:topoisomerase 1-associated factor 1 [Lepidopterella palustris CBS 459.81]
MANGTLDEWVEQAPVVDPEVRAHIYNLVSAIGGAGDDGSYELGDDALLCLKDLKKWLSIFENKLNRRDVARCMAEANLVKGDLLEILAKYSERVMVDKLKHKIALACLELLVPLTWPVEIDPMEATANHHRHIPFIQVAQTGYKRAILQFDRAKILQTAVRVALPSMAETRKERTPRDEGIIRIVLYFIRNIAMLSQSRVLPTDFDEAEVSRSATIDAFHDQDIFQVLLTVASSIGDEFVSQDVVVLEILYHILKGVDAEKLFMEEKKLANTNTEELKSLIQKEKAMLAGYARHAPTRHNRFGTMIWIKRDDEKVSTVSGQDVLGKAQKSMQKMDKTKKWNKPRHGSRRKDDEASRDLFDLPVPLSPSARKYLKAFVEEFLDSSFNPLFVHLRKAIEREHERVESRHSRQYFYLVAWFLRAECARRRQIKEKAAKKDAGTINAEDESFGLVAGVLNQETFILLNRFMQRSQDDKIWQDLNAGMKCFTQILLTVQEMSEAAMEEDQEIAENIQNRIFYEESTHDRIIHILRSYKDQGLGYLDACTELSHVFLRMLERYSKQNVDLQIRSRRRARKKQKVTEAPGQNDEGNTSEAEDVVEAHRTTTERKFDFARFSAKFMTQSCVNTFVTFTRFYNDLNADQLKRAHRFFYRVAFKMRLGIILCRVDILQLFNKMIKGPEGLDPDMPAFKEWEEFVRHFFRMALKKIQERPELVVEMLFSKINATMYYLEHGYDREVPTRAPRAPAELEVKPGMEKLDQIGVAVSVLVNQNKADALNWLKGILTSAAEERKSWEDMDKARKAAAQPPENDVAPAAAQEAAQEDYELPTAPSIIMKPDNDERRIALFKDNKLRLLLSLLKFQRVGDDDDPDASWIVPSSLSASELTEALDLIRKFEFDPPVYENGKTAEDFLRTKAAARRQRASFDDDSDDIVGSESEDVGEYAAGGPTTRKSDALKELKSRRRRRRRSRTPLEQDDDDEKTRRAEARRKTDLEKQKKMKSTMFVHDSDEESDEERDKEFYAREEEIRRTAGMNFLRGLTKEKIDDDRTKKRKYTDEPKKAGKKRKVIALSSDSSGNESEADAVNESSRASSVGIGNMPGQDTDEDDVTDTPLSSQQHDHTHGRDGKASEDLRIPVSTTKEDAIMLDDSDDEENEDIAPVRRPVARTVRAGFVIDSDSE